MKLEIKDLNKSFGEKHVLKNINFTAESGRALGLLGRNGAGKTTTIRIIMDVFPADSGEVLLDGRKMNHTELSIGYMPEERGLYPKRKIFEQLVYFCELKGMNRKKAMVSIDSWLAKLGMSEYRDKKLDTLSKGNQQKIQLISTVAFDPDIVILDEPFSGLDPVNSILLKEVVRELIDNGKIVIFSSHQMSYVEEFCDDIVIINSGQIPLHGPLKGIIRSYPRDKLVVTSSDIDSISGKIQLENYKEKDDLIVTMKRPEDKGEVMKDICGRFDIDAIKVYEPSLNDIFVEYTKDGI